MRGRRVFDGMLRCMFVQEFVPQAVPGAAQSEAAGVINMNGENDVTSLTS